jgi:hypothetical protein
MLFGLEQSLCGKKPIPVPIRFTILKQMMIMSSSMPFWLEKRPKKHSARMMDHPTPTKVESSTLYTETKAVSQLP